MITRCNKKEQHEMIEIVPGLKVCECSAYGSLQHLKGSVDDARRLVARAGGFDAVRARLKTEAEAKRKAAREDRENRQEKSLSAGRDNWQSPIKKRAPMGKVLS